MNREQYLLVKLAEESAEVGQIALKTAQFGLRERDPARTLDNLQRLHAELNDLLAVVNLLNLECGLAFEADVAAMEAKSAKISKYYKYSKELGKVS